ncbi:MAG: 1-phosphofructokinase family hexose kinase [Syntrophorhabdaceae bacterium]|nr:1-phosphofructokinase family hexose kinase [Syntrophorhabdaceae bacterium]
MIYTVTLNPSLDRIIEVEELMYDDVNEVVEEKSCPRGKGIDASRIIKELGGQSVALGFVGGYSGLEMEGGLVNEGILCDFTEIRDEIRTNVIIYQRKKKLQTLLSTREPSVSEAESAAFFRKIQEIPMNSIVVISGNMPAGMNESFYAQLITTLKGKHVRIFLDTDGEPLRTGVDAGPYLIKPNIHEFGRLVKRGVNEIDEIVEYAKPYENIVEYIVVSMGARGVVGISGQGNFHVAPPKVKVRSSTGSGDSLLAGIAFVLSVGGTFEDALMQGVACGTATALNPGNDLCKKEDIDFIKKDVIIKKI